MTPAIKEPRGQAPHSGLRMLQWLMNGVCLIEKPGSCCIEVTCLQITGRQGVHDCRWTTVGQEESSVGSSQPVELPGVVRRPRRSSFRGVSESEERVIVGTQAYRSIIPGQGSCKSKELNKKPLRNPQSSPLEKKPLADPTQGFQLLLSPVSAKGQTVFLSPYFDHSEREITGTTSKLGGRAGQKDYNTFPTAGS